MILNWMFIFLILGALGFVYLIFSSFGDIEAFVPRRLHDFLTKFFGVSMLSAVLFVLAVVTGHWIFVVLVYLAFGFLAVSLVLEYARRIYSIRYVKDTAHSWICRKCGAENGNINMECNKCKSRRAN